MTKEISRRRIIQLGGSVGLTAIALGQMSGIANEGGKQELLQCKAHLANSSSLPKNVIFMVSDGMSMGVPTLADPFALLLRDEGTIWPRLLTLPQSTHGLLETRSFNSLVTDSAAAASAWGCGKKVNNGSLNILPDRNKAIPLTVLLKDNNFRTGLVTTDKITGATPSGFAVVQKSRHDYMEISPQFIDRADLILGGGRKYFESNSRPDKRDLIAEYQSKGYKFCTNRKELLTLPSEDRILGLFSEDTMPYVIDLKSDLSLKQMTPSLAEMTQVAIKQLSDKDKGFFLMVEGGRVDHAAHTNDAAAILHEQIEFEDAIAIALEYIQEREDTLLIITSDHGNANPGLNGFGPGYSKTDESFACLAQINASFEKVQEKMRAASVNSELPDAANQVLQETCGFQVKSKIARIVGEALVENKLPEELAILQRSWVGVLSQVLGNHTGIGFTGTNHTADHTLLTTIGPGSNRFAGRIRHIDMHQNIVELMNLA